MSTFAGGLKINRTSSVCIAWNIFFRALTSSTQPGLFSVITKTIALPLSVCHVRMGYDYKKVYYCTVVLLTPLLFVLNYVEKAIFDL